MIRQLLSRKVTWVLVTALTLCLCYALARPVLCSDIEKCQLHHDDAADLIPYSRYITSALSAVLLHELVSVILTHRTAKKAIHLIPNIRESLLPSALLCTTFAVLLAENAAFLIGDTAWFAHAASVGDADLDGLPVYSVFYAEWLINVPILLILAGTCALSRPAPEVAEPLVITNVYMILAWCANFISSTPVRYCVVCVPWLLLAVSFWASFLMYFWASRDMILWVLRWKKENPEGLMFFPWASERIAFAEDLRLHTLLWILLWGDLVLQDYWEEGNAIVFHAVVEPPGIADLADLPAPHEALNCFGPLWLSRAAMPFLKKGNGSIVMIGSVAGVRPVGSSVPYSMTRAAMHQLTRLLAKSCGPVRVNCVAPGLIETRITAGSEWDGSYEAVKRMAPMKRVGKPDDLTDAVVCCIRSEYMTGQPREEKAREYAAFVPWWRQAGRQAACWPSILLGPASGEDGRLQAFQQAADANSLQLQVEALHAAAGLRRLGASCQLWPPGAGEIDARVVSEMQQNVASYALEGVCGPHDFIVTLVLQRKEERKAEEDDSAKKDGRKAEDDEDESTKRVVVVGTRFFLRALSDQGHEAMERAAKDAGGSSRSFDSRQSLLEFFERLSRRHAANASRVWASN
ncbi:Granaticin polyketide synthase putative ketoacyl reductase 2 [Symbiodinium microadriaticum]|uniref:Granaticin polyketide synthase putative ketoacyl reductase 2 n=1 Tax=Symbiodinium microadriaticum TaxID=2951 RepID=A0A1Q9CUZ2_SYMMI|nr:Granaticin polyketide synthase putative ketoacyl reductase 2 [Symbiodinium microadriaticum]